MFCDWFNESLVRKMDEMSKGMSQTGSITATDKNQEIDGNFPNIYLPRCMLVP